MSQMENFTSIECFVRSAEVGSFAEAARRLSLTPAAVGKSVAKLESRLGVRLFQRSTRRLTLTEAGQRFLEEVRASFNTIQNAVANLASAEGSPAGTLKVSVGTMFGCLYVVPLLGEFLRRYPAITPDWHFDNRQVDLIGQGPSLAAHSPQPGAKPVALEGAHDLERFRSGVPGGGARLGCRVGEYAVC